ncbi:MAG: DUF3500 domain-containing protein [Pirellulales bacterium]|nr:DUF3500 domain-containing protein [Pirellulales bacterium]
MNARQPSCPDCSPTNWNRREFLHQAGAAALAASALGSNLWTPAGLRADEQSPSQPESLVKQLYGSLNEAQRKVTCFDWEHVDSERGLLRTRVANNWQISEAEIGSDLFNKDQQALIRQIFEGLYNPEWVKRIDQQLDDDAGGYGVDQTIAIFGKPGEDKFEFVMTGRHLTIRCDGNSADHVAFGGPIFYGHAAEGFNEQPNHPGNVFWPQALAANKIFQMLDGKQRAASLISKLPHEQAVAFRGTAGGYPGLPMKELSSDQREHAQQVLMSLLEPYRASDRDEALACLKTQGGLDACSLAFYKEGDIGNDEVWDCWRIEGPSFVWYYRGAPHVHVWVNVADDPSIKLNA